MPYGIPAYIITREYMHHKNKQSMINSYPWNSIFNSLNSSKNQIDKYAPKEMITKCNSRVILLVSMGTFLSHVSWVSTSVISHGRIVFQAATEYYFYSLLWPLFTDFSTLFNYAPFELGATRCTKPTPCQFGQRGPNLF